MRSQGGRLQLEQSDMCLALNVAKMAKGGFSHPAIEETLGIATHLANPPAVRVRTAKTVRFSAKLVQNPIRCILAAQTRIHIRQPAGFATFG